MNLRSLQYFLVSAEEMHFTNAAKKLYITQQSLSAHIQKLEKLYGVTLFERKPHLRLTPAGECMVRYALRILETESQMNAEFADITDNVRGKLVIGIPRNRAKRFIPDIWHEYKQIYPNVDIVLVEGLSTFFEERLLSGRLDMYIGVDDLETPNIQKILLSKDRIFCVICDEMLRQYFPDNMEDRIRQFQNSTDIAALGELPFIMLPRANRIRIAVDRCFAAAGITPHVIFETNDHEMIYNLCQKGFGAGFISQFYMYQSVLNGFAPTERPHVFPLMDEHSVTQTVLAYRSDRYLPKYAQAFIEVSKSVFHAYNRLIGWTQNTD